MTTTNTATPSVPIIEVGPEALGRRPRVADYIGSLARADRAAPALALAIACAASARMQLRDMAFERVMWALERAAFNVECMESELPGLRGCARAERRDDLTWERAKLSMYEAEYARREAAIRAA